MAYRHWSEPELRALRDNYPAHGAQWEGWDGLLPDRTCAAISRKAHDLGIACTDEARSRIIADTRRRSAKALTHWSNDELVALCEHYPDRGPRWPRWRDVLPGRTSQSIMAMAHRVGLRHRRLDWTESDDDAIREHYPGRGPAWPGWAELLPGKTSGQIRQRASRLGVAKGRRLTKGQRAYVLKYVLQIAENIGATPRDVAREMALMAEDWREQQ